MKCEEYREAITADPSESFDGGSAHAAACAPCAAFRAEVRKADERIARALAIDVPELELPKLPSLADGAPSNVTVLPARGSPRSRLPAWLGVAAVLAAAAVLGVRVLTPESPSPTLAAQVIAHMDHEEASRQVTTVAVSDQALRDAIDADVSQMDQNIGLISYARTCVINGHTVPHLVVQGTSGPITLILLPDETIDNAIPLNGERVHGVILPVGSGSVAIIGQRQEQLAEVGAIGQRVVESVKWSL
jgi:anti-sigma factor RsiW